MKKKCRIYKNFFRSIFFWFFSLLLFSTSAFSQSLFDDLGLSKSTSDSGSNSSLSVITKVEKATPLIVWNHFIITFRGSYGDITPEERVEGATKRIAALPESSTDWHLAISDLIVGNAHAKAITSHGVLLFVILPDDLDVAAGETLQKAADKAMVNLKVMLVARSKARNIPIIMRGIGFTLLASSIFVLLLFFVSHIRRIMLDSVDKVAKKTSSGWVFHNIDIRGVVLGAEKGLVRFWFFSMSLLLTYLWFAFILKQFPYSEPLGIRLGAYLLSLLLSFWNSIIDAVPGLFTIIVIFALTKIVTSSIARFLRNIEQGKVHPLGFDSETARATRRILIVLIWVFALTLAYPNIPGSNTAAFKGISVLLGLIFSLGSTGLVQQMMSGLMIVYSKTLRPGDYVRIAESEGTIKDIGVLSTKIFTPRREEISIPNAVIIGTTTTNYSRLSEELGSSAYTTVSIGYDEPWRQIHSLLMGAADKTQGIKKVPLARVWQRNLNDFYVEYMLLVHLEKASDRVPVLSELHANIQDAFNESGVQIMSPHYMLQPNHRVIVPKENWQKPTAPL